MNDFAYIAIFFAFFAVAGLFVKACDMIIGPDEAEGSVDRTELGTEPETLAA
jgi:hypothetical protein